MLSLLGPDLSPRVVAVGERRVAGLLREAFLATETLYADPVVEVASDAEAARLGAFVGRLHAGGVVHGGLFPRNLLRTADGGFRVLDLDRMRRTGRPDRRAFDLACLAASLHPDERRCAAALRGYRDALPEEAAGLRERVAARIAEAQARIARRLRRR
jgi:tRNA A-37 threonylcarbamoyl transferase component Bud32